MQLTLFDAICPTCLTPWAVRHLTMDLRPFTLDLQGTWMGMIPCSLACL